MTLRTLDLSVSVEGRPIVRKVSIEVAPGEPVFLLGPNGSGKSTLLKGIIGIPSYQVSEGRILLDGEDITNLPSWERIKKGLWIVHQTTYPLSVPSYFLLEKISKKRNVNVDIEGVMSNLGISHLYYREAFNGFSGGEAKKLELATAVISQSKYILMDEPDSGVDIDSLRIISKHVNRWLDEGKAVVIVTHLGAISNFVNKEGRAYVLINGSIVYEGKATEVIDMILEKGYSTFRGGGS